MAMHDGKVGFLGIEHTVYVIPMHTCSFYDSNIFNLEPSISMAKFLGIWLSSALYAEVFHQNYVWHTKLRAPGLRAGLSVF